MLALLEGDSSSFSDSAMRCTYLCLTRITSSHTHAGQRELEQMTHDPGYIYPATDTCFLRTAAKTRKLSRRSSASSEMIEQLSDKNLDVENTEKSHSVLLNYLLLEGRRTAYCQNLRHFCFLSVQS